MHEIFGLKHVLSTFQETVWSHLKFPCFIEKWSKHAQQPIRSDVIYDSQSEATLF